jgi:hypothetical protein
VAVAVALQSMSPVEEPVVSPNTTIDGTTPTTSPTPTTGPTPSGIPVEESGTLVTPIGEIEWRHFSGPKDSLPRVDGGLVSTPTGYLAVALPVEQDAGRNKTLAELADLRFWRSDDGYEWTSSALPIPLEPRRALIETAGGVAWLLTREPETLWRSDDGENWDEVALPAGASGVELYDVDGEVWLLSSVPAGAFRLVDGGWQEVDTSAVQPPDISGVEWRLVPAQPLRVGDTTVIPWNYRGDVDWAELVDIDPAESPYGAWTSEAYDTIEIWGDFGAGAQFTLSVAVDGNRITFSDETGPIHEIVTNDPGNDPARILPQLGFFGIREATMLIVDQGTVTQTATPWGQLPEPVTPQFLSVDGLVAFSADAGQPRMWTSSNGSEWTESPLPEFMLGQAFLLRVIPHGDSQAILAEGDTGIWVSLDGREWTFTGVPFFLETAPLGDGAVIFEGHDENIMDVVAVSSDLMNWTSVDAGELPWEIGGINFAGSMYTEGAGDLSVRVHVSEGTGWLEVWLLKAP